MIEDNPVKLISDQIHSLFINHRYRLKNTYIFRWESDFFSISGSGYVYEVEIKISRSDFKADFEKVEKHNTLSSKLESSNKNRPNKFFYACPIGLLKKEEIPEYAGLIEIDNGCVLRTKEAPFLHKDQLFLKGTLLEKFYWKSINQEIEISKLQRQIRIYENEAKQKTTA